MTRPWGTDREPAHDGLVAGGVDITLFTIQDSLTAAELDAVVAAPAKLWPHSPSSVFVSLLE